jgi:hypothetical protein
MSSYATAKEILRRAFPAEVLRSQPQQDWQGTVPLPDAIAQYFEEFGPLDVTIEGYGNPYFLPSLSRLWAFQTGYRFHDITHDRLMDWHEDWFVVADEGGNAFIFSQASHTILHAYHGSGIWEPTQVFENLVEMVTTFAILGEIVTSAGNALTDDDSVILPQHQEVARTRIGDFLNSWNRADTLISRLGWGQF